MSGAQFHRDNHFVPCVYLKHFCGPDGRISSYQLLVAHERIRLWKPHWPKSIGWRRHLYTREVAGGESDEIETWLAAEFEAPAEEAIGKAVSNASLQPKDWTCLARFVAAQDVRTPARLLENFERWDKSLPDLLDRSLQTAVREWEAAKRLGRPRKQHGSGLPTEYIPIRVTKQIAPGETHGTLKAELLAGRGMWFFSMRHTLTRTLRALEHHKWTILRAPEGAPWFTSDDPVIRLNYSSESDYSLHGGWGSEGTEIMLPLSPQHLLYTQVGEQPPRRGTVVTREVADSIRRVIASRAHRSIFAAEADAEVPAMRPRVVNADQLRSEDEQWRRWHEEQSAAEREYLDSVRTAT
jgi:hypothetical protein